MTKLTALLALTAAALLAATGTAGARTLPEIRASGTLHLYTTPDFPPFSSIIGNITQGGGEPVGFEVELGNLIAAKLGVKPQWQVRPFESLIGLAMTNEDVDLVIASHAITSTRLKQVDFSNPHFCTGGVLLTKKGGPLTSKALLGKRVGAEGSSTYASYVKKLPYKAELIQYLDSASSLEALLAGKVDAVVTDRFAALAAAKSNAAAGLVVSQVLWKEQSGIVLAKHNTALRLAVNAALAELMRDGSYERLSRKYFGQDIRC